MPNAHISSCDSILLCPQASFRSFVALKLQKPPLRSSPSTKQKSKNSAAGDMPSLVVALEAICAMKTALVTLLRDISKAVITSTSASELGDGRAGSDEHKRMVKADGAAEPESGKGTETSHSCGERGRNGEDEAGMQERQVQDIVAGFESSLVTIVLNASPAQLLGKP